MPGQLFNAFPKLGFCLMALLLLFALSDTGYAIPAFARMYGTSCSTCHIDFPKLNDFGKAFKDAGFKPEFRKTSDCTCCGILSADGLERRPVAPS